MAGKIPAKYPVKSLSKALRLLELVGQYSNGASISALTKELRMGKSTVHRLLATLREFDLVWCDPNTSNYSLGSRILHLNDLLVRQNLLVRHGLPVLRELASACNETSNLGVLDGTDVLYVAQFESTERLRIGEAVGERMPAHCTSMGKALLATLPEKEFDDLYRNVNTFQASTTYTITDKDRLKEHLRKVNQDGVAYDFEENAVGVACMAAVVRNFSGMAIAAMSISMPIQRLRGENIVTFKEYLSNAALKLSVDLGYAVSPASPRNLLDPRNAIQVNS